MIALLRIVVFLAALIPFAEMIYIAIAGQQGSDSNAFILRYSGLWALNFLVFSLAIAPAIRIIGFNALAGLQSMMSLFVFVYATFHVIAWVVIDVNWNWQAMIDSVMQDMRLLAGVVAYFLMIPLIVSHSQLIQQLLGSVSRTISKLIIPVIVLSMIHFFLVVSEDRTMPGIYAGVFLALLGYREKVGAIPRSVPDLVSRLLRK